MKPMIRAVLMALLIAAHPQTGRSETDYPTVKAGVSRESATVGEVIDYTVSITGRGVRDMEILKPAETVYFPDKDKKSGAAATGKDKKSGDDAGSQVPLYIIHEAKKEDNSSGSVEYITLTMKISYYRPGRHLLPEVTISGKDRVRVGYKVPEVEIKPVNEKSEFVDIEPPLDLGGNYARLIYLALALVAATAGAVFLARYIRKRRRERVVPAAASSPR